MSVLLSVFASEVVLILMGDQWSGAVRPFQIMVIALYFRTAYKFTGTVLRATGSVYYGAFLQWSYAGFVVIGALFGVRFGLEGVAIGTTVAVALCYFSGVALLAAVFKFEVGRCLKPLLRHAGLSIVYFLVLLAMRELGRALALPALVSLALGVLGALATFTALHRFWPNALGEEREVISLLIAKVIRR